MSNFMTWWMDSSGQDRGIVTKQTFNMNAEYETEQSSFSKGEYLPAENSTALLRSPKGLCFDSPLGVCQSLHAAVLSALDSSNITAFARSYDK